MRLLTFVLATLACVAAGGVVSAAPPLAAYGKLPALDLVQISPSGDRIAFVAVDGEARRLFVRKVGGDAIIVKTVGTGKVRELKWVGDDFVLVYATATAKFGNAIQTQFGHNTRAEFEVVLVVDVNKHTILPMFDPKAQDPLFGAIDGDYGARKVGGRWYEFVHAYTLQINQGDVYKVDLETLKYTVLTTNTGDEYDYFIGGEGSVAAHSKYFLYTKNWGVFPGLKGEQKDQAVLIRESPLFTVHLKGMGRTDGTVLISDRDAQKVTFEEFPIAANAKPTPLFEDKRVLGVLRDPETDVLLGALSEDGQSAVFFNPKLQRRFDAARKAFAGYQITLESYSTDLAKMVIMTDGSDDSGTHWLIDMTTGKAEDLMAAYPDIDQKDVGPTKMFAYTAADGLPLEGVLTLPRGSAGKNLPLVMMPHGGPWGARDRLGFDWWAQAFASRGYAVFQPNYRGSSGYGVPFEDKGDGEWGRKMLTDMSDGMSALAAAGIVDAKRACIVGASYGGYAAMAGVTIQQALYRCAVSYAGVSDVGGVMTEDGFNDENPYGRDNQKHFGAKTPFDASIVAISPLRHAKNADAPILLIHGRDDTRVPIVHSLSMNDALKGAHKSVELITLDGEDHFLSREATRVKTLEASVAFVEKYNPPDPQAVAPH